MRDIKFRAWTGKEMIYQDKQYLASFIRRVVPQIIRDHGGEPFSQHESYLPNGGNLDEYLMQFTGLKDYKDKEIYEGDIVRCQYAEDRGPRFVDVVEWSNCEFKIGTYGLGQIEAEEVIGNIYEDPEIINIP